MSQESDARLGRPWTPRQRLKNDAIWLLASLALGASRPLSLGAMRWIGRKVGLAASVLVPSAREIARRNIARVFPALSEDERGAAVRRCFVALGEHLGETLTMLGRPLPPLEVCPEARRVFAEALGEKRGVLFASAHLGPWERVAASLVAAGIPMTVLGRESYDPRFTRLYAELRARHGVEVAWRGQPGAAARILRTLRGNKVLGVPMDLRARVPTCSAPFLGHVAPTPVGPARIALHTRARVVAGSAAPGRHPGDPLVVTATAVDTHGLAPDAEGALELTCRINAELSRRILALPDAWVWMHERWDAPLERG